MGNLLAPSPRLAVEILQGGEGAGREEAGADVPDGALNPPFSLPRAGRQGSVAK